MDRSTPTIMSKRHNRLSPSSQAVEFDRFIRYIFSDFYAIILKS